MKWELTISPRMDPLRHYPSGEHDIRCHRPSHIIHQIIAVRKSSGRRKGKGEQEDEHAGQEDTDESLELVPSKLLEP